MSFLKGKQIATGSDGVATANLTDNVLSADSAGRAKIQTDYFNFTTVGTKFTTASIALTKLEEAVIQADGGQAFTADQSIGGFKLTNLGTPTLAGDATSKSYVDSLANGLDWKNSVRLATTSSIALTGSQQIDSVSASIGDRVLVKNQTSGSQNGIYVIAAGAWTRATDADADVEVTAGMAMFVEEGTTNGDQGWVLNTDNPITLGTTSLTFTQFTGTGAITAGQGLTKTGNILDVGAGPGIIVLADNVEVSYFSGSVSAVSAGVAASLGTSPSASRGDHVHAVFTATAVGLASANAEGSSNALARADHTHVRDLARYENVAITASVTADSGLPSFAGTPITSSNLHVYLNGLLQRQGSGFDYTISGATITWLAGTGTAVDLATNDELLVYYFSAT